MSRAAANMHSRSLTLPYLLEATHALKALVAASPILMPRLTASALRFLKTLSSRSFILMLMSSRVDSSIMYSSNNSNSTGALPHRTRELQPAFAGALHFESLLDDTSVHTP